MDEALVFWLCFTSSACSDFSVGASDNCCCTWIVKGVFAMKLSDIPIYDLWFYIPDDIITVLVAVFAFLCVLAVWRILK